MSETQTASAQRDNSLDGVTFDVIVHRLRPPLAPGATGEWLVRVFHAHEHVHSTEGGVSYGAGLREAARAMEAWVDSHGGGALAAAPWGGE